MIELESLTSWGPRPVIPGIEVPAATKGGSDCLSLSDDGLERPLPERLHDGKIQIGMQALKKIDPGHRSGLVDRDLHADLAPNAPAPECLGVGRLNALDGVRRGHEFDLAFLRRARLTLRGLHLCY